MFTRVVPMKKNFTSASDKYLKNKLNLNPSQLTIKNILQFASTYEVPTVKEKGFCFKGFVLN